MGYDNYRVLHIGRGEADQLGTIQVNTELFDKFKDSARNTRMTPSPCKVLAATSPRTQLILRDIADPRFRPLSATSWRFCMNPEFARLEVTFAASQQATATRYVERFSQLGHAFDLALDLDGQELRLSRPVCTNEHATVLTFDFLGY